MFHLLKAHLLHLYKSLLGKFVKPTEISANLNNLSSIDYTNRCNQVEDRELVIGFTTQQTIMKLFNEGSIDKQHLLKFYKSVRQFFTSAMDYLIMWCPLSEEIQGHAVWIDLERKLDAG